MKWTLALILAVHALAADVKLETPTGTLHGTLELPPGNGPFPIALIHAGSGPTDRDGNSPVLQGKNDSLKKLAEELAKHGIASLRYDKRGVAASAKAIGKEDDLRFEMYIDDLVAWGKQMRADKRFGKIVIVGHSEGALIGTMAAAKLAADAFVSVAGAGKPAGQIIVDQLSSAPAALQQRGKEIVAALDQGKTVTAVPQELAPLFRASAQPYLISWFKYDPAKELAKLKMPVLIVQGTTDIQVKMSDARLLAAAKPAAKLLTIEGMNHVLKLVSADIAAQAASYSNPALPIAPKLITELVAFIKR